MRAALLLLLVCLLLNCMAPLSASAQSIALCLEPTSSGLTETVRIELGARLTGAEPGRFHFLREGNTLSFEADALLIAAGRLPESGLADALAARGLPTLTIGDARDVRRIGDAVHDAYWALADFTRARGPEATELTSLAF